MADLVQITEQTPKQRGNPNWRPGVSANPAGKESPAARSARIDRIVDEWAGGATLTAAERDLLKHAAGLTLSRKRRTAEDEVRVVNTVRAILRQCGLLTGRKRDKAPALSDYMRGKYGRP
jgi:hypothetical protein